MAESFLSHGIAGSILEELSSIVLLSVNCGCSVTFAGFVGSFLTNNGRCIRHALPFLAHDELRQIIECRAYSNTDVIIGIELSVTPLSA
jgi:hypothetical protein